jgi:hypothetical protein
MCTNQQHNQTLSLRPESKLFPKFILETSLGGSPENFRITLTAKPGLYQNLNLNLSNSCPDILDQLNTLQTAGIKINQTQVSIDGDEYIVQIIIPLFYSVNKGKFLGSDVQLKGGYYEVPFNNGWYRNYNPGSYQIAVYGKYKYQSMMNWLDYK